MCYYLEKWRSTNFLLSSHASACVNMPFNHHLWFSPVLENHVLFFQSFLHANRSQHHVNKLMLKHDIIIKQHSGHSQATKWEYVPFSLFSLSVLSLHLYVQTFQSHTQDHEHIGISPRWLGESSVNLWSDPHRQGESKSGDHSCSQFLTPLTRRQ